MIFDAHGDILTDMYYQSKLGNEHSFVTRHLERYKNGNITHSIFVNWTNPNTANRHEFVEIFDAAFKEINEHKDIFTVCKTYQDLEHADKETIAVILGMEGVGQLTGTDQLRELYDKGVRHASLTWNDDNDYAGGLDNLNTKGITEKGAAVLAEMEQLGMIIDLSHLNQKAFQEVFDHTKGPLIISHGNTYELCSHRRNYTDDQLRLLQSRDGVIGICAIADFLSHNPEEHTVSMFVDHIDHVVKTIGIDHVGLGLDVCYYLTDIAGGTKVKGFETIDQTNNIITELQNRSYSDEDIEKILSKNFLRVIQKILR